MKSLSVALLVAVAAASVAQGAIVTYDFTNDGWGVAASHTVGWDAWTSPPPAPTPLNVTATASRQGPGPAFVNWTANGLGVSTSLFDNPQIDGWGPDETLTLTFDTSIMINTATVSMIYNGWEFFGDDDVRMLMDGNLLGNFDPQASGTVTLDLTGLDEALRTGSMLDFTVVGNNDDYKLAGLEIDYSVAPGPQIPEPSTVAIWSLLGAMGVAIGWWRKRRAA